MEKSEKTKEVDARTNLPVPKLEFEVHSPEDYAKLREKFRKMPPTPVLVHVDDVEREEFPELGRRYDWLLRSEQSGGSIVLHRITIFPPFHATDHNHISEGEFFYVLEGEAEITVGNQTTGGGPGTFAYVPPFCTHAFRPLGDQPCRILHWNIPGWHERLTDEMTRLKKAGHLTPETRRHAQESHEFFFHEPKPS
jgi:mannose-6-phosphate isomerase-like protein (cupin superfamily)